MDGTPHTVDTPAVPTVARSFTNYQAEVARTRDLITAAEAWPRLRGNLVVELALLRAVGSWELLVEQVFVGYVLGKPSRSGRTYVSLVRVGGAGARRVTEEAVRTALLGGRDFIEWFPRDVVKARAAQWFPGDDGFTSAYVDLADFADIRAVRNRIAHNSGDARAKFRKVRERHVRSVARRRGMGPGQFLRATTRDGVDTVSRIERYLRQFDRAAATLTA